MQGQEAQKKTGIASRSLILILTGACCGIAAGGAAGMAGGDGCVVIYYTGIEVV